MLCFVSGSGLSHSVGNEVLEHGFSKDPLVSLKVATQNVPRKTSIHSPDSLLHGVLALSATDPEDQSLFSTAKPTFVFRLFVTSY